MSVSYAYLFIKQAPISRELGACFLRRDFFRYDLSLLKKTGVVEKKQKKA